MRIFFRDRRAARSLPRILLIRRRNTGQLAIIRRALSRVNPVTAIEMTRAKASISKNPMTRASFRLTVNSLPRMDIKPSTSVI